MFDVNDDAKGEYRRVEVLTGPGRRRRWSADEKARIVAETLVPGARVSEVARRWQICSQQVFGWRGAMRQDLPSVPGKTTTPATPSFIPIVSEAIRLRRFNARCLRRQGSRSSLPVRWCGSRPAWMMLPN